MRSIHFNIRNKKEQRAYLIDVKYKNERSGAATDAHT